jgi:hypothetical protein
MLAHGRRSGGFDVFSPPGTGRAGDVRETTRLALESAATRGSGVHAGLTRRRWVWQSVSL